MAIPLIIKGKILDKGVILEHGLTVPLIYNGKEVGSAIILKKDDGLYSEGSFYDDEIGIASRKMIEEGLIRSMGLGVILENDVPNNKYAIPYTKFERIPPELNLVENIKSKMSYDFNEHLEMFTAAYMTLTNLPPDKVVMNVEQMYVDGKFTQRIWFEKKDE